MRGKRMVKQKWVVNNQAIQYKGQGKFEIESTKGCLYNVTIIWLTNNQLQNNDQTLWRETRGNDNIKYFS